MTTAEDYKAIYEELIGFTPPRIQHIGESGTQTIGNCSKRLTRHQFHMGKVGWCAVRGRHSWTMERLTL